MTLSIKDTPTVANGTGVRGKEQMGDKSRKKKTGWHRVYKHKWLAERVTSQRTPSFSHIEPKTMDKLLFMCGFVCTFSGLSTFFPFTFSHW